MLDSQQNQYRSHGYSTMNFKPSLSVKETLDHLSVRLDPIIAAKLKPYLGGLPWTKILEILDGKKGSERSHRYRTNDLQAQLRVLSQRLGDLGYPFDNGARFVSSTANKLKIYRNASAHNEVLTVRDAYRAADASVELLLYFNDDEGLTELRRIRREALVALAEQEGVSEDSAEKAAVLEPTTDYDDDPSDGNEKGKIEPDPEVLEQAPEDPDDQILGLKRLPYEPWEVVPVGEKDVLYDLRSTGSKESVRSVVNEIASFEGPVHVERLARLTARSFDLKKLSKSRAKALVRQFRSAGLYIDEDNFVWPRDLDPNTWSEFRPNDSTVRRFFLYISPIEILNAAKFIKAKHPEMSDLELEAAVLRTFGKKRRTEAVREHLAKVKELM